MVGVCRGSVARLPAFVSLAGRAATPRSSARTGPPVPLAAMRACWGRAVAAGGAGHAQTPGLSGWLWGGQVRRGAEGRMDGAF